MATITADLDKWNLLQSRVQRSKVVSAFDVFRRARIEPILIKGWAASRNYPPDRIRRPGDIDLAVAPKDYADAWKLSHGPNAAEFGIDLHEGLRALDSLNWDDIFEHSQLVDLDGSRIRLLSDEDHLRVLCTHWLIDGGGYEDKLWDIYYAVENRPKSFDWDRCLNVVDQNRRGWVICAIGLAHRFLGLNISDLPIADEASNIPGWVIKCVEREWQRAYRLQPVLHSSHDKRLLIDQIRRRLPPNPIRATVECKGDLYGRWRLPFQMTVLLKRSVAFAGQVINLLVLKIRRPRK